MSPVELRVSIIVPVRDEEAVIRASLARLRRDFADCELIVVDGGSTDRTAELAASLATVTSSPAGRGIQMNAGAQLATGDVLWFVHADTEISPEALPQLRAALADPTTIGGGLTLRFAPSSPSLALVARMSNVRARLLHQVYGDQALFVRRTAFEELGGFAPLPLMEDLDLSPRLQRTGRLVLLAATSRASSRRFQQHGTWPMVALMQYLKLCFYAGVDPERIRQRYEYGPPRLRRRRPKPTADHRRTREHRGAAHPH